MLNYRHLILNKAKKRNVLNVSEFWEGENPTKHDLCGNFFS